MPTKTKEIKLGVYYSAEHDRVILVVEVFAGYWVAFYSGNYQKQTRYWHPTTIKELGFKWIGEL